MIVWIVVLAAALILAAVAAFAYLGGYWFELWKGDDE